jgi:hypothetical protein
MTSGLDIARAPRPQSPARRRGERSRFVFGVTSLGLASRGLETMSVVVGLDLVVLGALRLVRLEARRSCGRAEG